jgi:hypothetical protein
MHSRGTDISVYVSTLDNVFNKQYFSVITWLEQVPEFEEAAFSAPLKKVVRCKTKFGWHLVQVLSER